MLVSIIIPTFNRADALNRTLRSVAQVDFAPDNFEILVVDNGSTDRTREAFEAARSQAPGHHWRYFHEPMPGLLSGRHKGALESRGDICAFIDDDVRLDIDWLNAMKEIFAEPSVILAGGPSRPIFESSPPEWLQGFYYENEEARFCGDLSLLDGGERIKKISPILIWGLNYGIRKKSLFDFGGFHPDSFPRLLQRFQGDGESGLSLKISQGGGSAMYHPQIAVQHEVSATRLTSDYFQTRSFFQGVCDSYTEIRMEKRLSSPKWSWKEPLRRSKRFVKKMLYPKRSELAALKDRTAQAYKNGFDFHQKEVRRDPELLEWVLRQDYWAYALPEGWENYLKHGRRSRALHSNGTK